jgi:hypothetical protein
MSRKKRSNKKTKKHLSQTKKFRKMNCSPKSKDEKKSGFSCYSNRSLYKLKESWNKKFPDKLIRSNKPENIWLSLKYLLNNICDDEKCWLKQKFMENNLDPELKSLTFAPYSPIKWEDNPNEWLSSVDLNRVMKQYEMANPFFAFIGPSPIDFDKTTGMGECVWNDLCNFDLIKYVTRGKNKIGVIFNTDPHTSDGSHWVCAFIDVKNKFIFYFDSVADPMLSEINKFFKRVRDQGKSLGIDFKIIKNKTTHQKTTTECGMYTLFVIIQLMNEKMKPESFKERIKDEHVEKLRNIYFNKKH